MPSQNKLYFCFVQQPVQLGNSLHLKIAVGMVDIQDTRAFPLLILISIFSLISFNKAESNYDHHFFEEEDRDSANASFVIGLSSHLDSVSSKASHHKFYNDSSNQIYSLYQCRGDVNLTTCHTCVKATPQEIQDLCQHNKSAVIWFKDCMLRYSNEDFFGIPETYTLYWMWDNNCTESCPRVGTGAVALINELVEKASHSESMFKMDERVAPVNSSWNTYGLVQCTRDISNISCKNCLVKLLKNIEQCCQEMLQWRIMSPSCQLRYEQTLFKLPPLPGPPMPGSGKLML